MECRDALFGPFKLDQDNIMERAYESILEVINDKTDKKQGNDTTLDYYEAVRKIIISYRAMPS